MQKQTCRKCGTIFNGKTSFRCPACTDLRVFPRSIQKKLMKLDKDQMRIRNVAKHFGSDPLGVKLHSS